MIKFNDVQIGDVTVTQQHDMFAQSVMIKQFGHCVIADREQAAQLAEVLKRYSETGRIDE